MSRNQRVGLIIAAAVVAVLAFVIASPGGGDDGGKAAQTQAETTVAPKPPVSRIQIRGGQVVGGAAEIKVKKGDTVVIDVSADAPDDIHLHGYDIEKKVEPGQPAQFRFKANLEGEFEIESHVAEDAGRDPLVGTLIVEPR
jgi:FtsP/CotA-like multicopper oxidase with cupredoxin domain